MALKFHVCIQSSITWLLLFAVSSGVSSFVLTAGTLQPRQSIPALRAVFDSTHGREEGDVVSDKGLDHDYVLHTAPSEAISSGTAEIQEAYRRCDETGEPVGEKVMIKFSENTKMMQREVENTEDISDASNEDFIINVLDHNIPHSSTNEKMRGDTALIVMEKGSEDLLSYINNNDDLQHGDKLRQTMYSLVKSIASIHAKGLVWSDVKLSNFIVQDEAKTVKAIDLESCAPVGSYNPPKFTPSTCPPEFAWVIQRCLDGQVDDVDHQVDYSFDIWSLGVILWSVVTGTSFHRENMDIEAITATLATIDQHSIDNDERLYYDTVDRLARDFILKCLRVDPLERATIEDLQWHPLLVGSTSATGSTFTSKEPGSTYEQNHISAYEEQLQQYYNQNY